MFSRARGLESSVARRRRGRRLKIRLVVLSLFLILLLGGVFYAAYTPRLRIERIYVLGNTFLSSEEVMSLAGTSLSGKYLYLLPKNNIFLYPRKEIVQKLLSSYPEIKEVFVSMRDFRSINIALSERVGEFLWCSPGSEEKGEECYLIDNTGFIFRRAEEVSSNSLRFYSALPGAPIGTTILPREEFDATISFVMKLREIGVPVVSVTLGEGGLREGGLSVGGKVIWNRTQDQINAIENLKLLLQNPDFKGKDKDGVLSIDYIDIQNTNKIFYIPR